jgi:hypothetical protein
MHGKVSSDWLPSYIKAMGPVLKIFKMARYFPDRLRILCLSSVISLDVERPHPVASLTTLSGAAVSSFMYHRNYTAMHHITTFRSKTDRIYDGGPIIL